MGVRDLFQRNVHPDVRNILPTGQTGVDVPGRLNFYGNGYRVDIHKAQHASMPALSVCALIAAAASSLTRSKTRSAPAAQATAACSRFMTVATTSPRPLCQEDGSGTELGLIDPNPLAYSAVLCRISNSINDAGAVLVGNDPGKWDRR